MIYIHIPEVQVLFLLDVYGKDEAEDLDANEKKSLRGLAVNLVEEIRNTRGR